ncbi:MAG: DNA mismatch repair protein MutS, partial [Gemmatimonadetes bacterium]|nr:DNA mismatch repair protein MutS [Gemmatimonadota bacterium]
KAAICEQVEDAKSAKGLVRREVIRILTPGTVVEDHLLEESASNYLVSVTRADGGYGLAAAECSTGELMVTEFAGDDAWGELLDEVGRLQPVELLIAEEAEHRAELARLVSEQGGTTTTWGGETFLTHAPRDLLLAHFGVTSLRGFGCEAMPAAIEAAAAI